MNRIAHLILIVLFSLSIYSCKKSNILPIYDSFSSALQNDPIQTTTDRTPFVAKIDKQTHQIEPLFEYQISGMVVSCGFSKNQAEYRKDKLNIMDVGLIWGKNLNPEMYRNVNFETDGVWLKATTDDLSTWKKLDPHQISNNHLLSNNPEMIKQIKSVKRGSIISIKGCLASYSGRKSSVSRKDSGATACETIWVDEFEVLQHGTKKWHLVNRGSLCGILAWFVLKMLSLFFL